MASQKGLGKGLGALLGDFTEEPAVQSGLKTLPLHKIEPNPDQPRRDFDPEELEELAESIRTHGIIQPLTGFGAAVIMMVAATAYYDITVAPTLVALICAA